MVRMMGVHVCAWVCMVMPVVCWGCAVSVWWAWFLRLGAAALCRVHVPPLCLPACARMCVIGWSFRGVHGGVFMVCEMVVAVLFCLSRWCVYSLLGSTSPVVHMWGAYELACVWSECVFFWSACRVCVLCSCSAFRACVRVLAC